MHQYGNGRIVLRAQSYDQNEKLLCVKDGFIEPEALNRRRYSGVLRMANFSKRAFAHWEKRPFEETEIGLKGL